MNILQTMSEESKYTDSKIYKLWNTVNDSFYVGSTTMPYLCNRISLHRQSSKDESGRRSSPLYTTMRDTGRQNWKITLIEEFPCKSKEELQDREQHWINELKPNLNKVRAFVSDEDLENRSKEQYEKNKLKESFLENQKKYRKEHSAYNKEKLQCEHCAKKISRNWMSQHFKIKHPEFYKPLWGNGKTVEELKEKIQCACGSSVIKSSMREHVKTKKHKKWEDEQTAQQSESDDADEI